MFVGKMLKLANFRDLQAALKLLKLQASPQSGPTKTRGFKSEEIGMMSTRRRTEEFLSNIGISKPLKSDDYGKHLKDKLGPNNEAPS